MNIKDLKYYPLFSANLPGSPQAVSPYIDGKVIPRVRAPGNELEIVLAGINDALRYLESVDKEAREHFESTSFDDAIEILVTSAQILTAKLAKE